MSARFHARKDVMNVVFVIFYLLVGFYAGTGRLASECLKSYMW